MLDTRLDAVRAAPPEPGRRAPAPADSRGVLAGRDAPDAPPAAAAVLLGFPGRGSTLSGGGEIGGGRGATMISLLTPGKVLLLSLQIHT